jgi:hypothetical protein
MFHIGVPYHLIFLSLSNFDKLVTKLDIEGYNWKIINFDNQIKKKHSISLFITAMKCQGPFSI